MHYSWTFLATRLESLPSLLKERESYTESWSQLIEKFDESAFFCPIKDYSILRLYIAIKEWYIAICAGESISLYDVLPEFLVLELIKFVPYLEECSDIIENNHLDTYCMWSHFFEYVSKNAGSTVLSFIQAEHTSFIDRIDEDKALEINEAFRASVGERSFSFHDLSDKNKSEDSKLEYLFSMFSKINLMNIGCTAEFCVSYLCAMYYWFSFHSEVLLGRRAQSFKFDKITFNSIREEI